MAKNDPYHDHKIFHFAALIRRDGAVSPLCAPKPRAINLKVATWTISEDAVTCSKCLAALGKACVDAGTGDGGRGNG